MAKGGNLTGRVESIAPGGAGFLRAGGKSVFVDMAAPGDLISFTITEDHRDWARGEITEILEPGPGRTTALCPVYGLCGGCSLQHLSYGDQIEAKKGILKEVFRRIGEINELPEITFHPSSPWEYRNRVQFHARREIPAPGKEAQALLSLGFKQRKSSRIVSLCDCPAAAPGIRSLLRDLPQKGLCHLPPGKERFTLYAGGGAFLCEGVDKRGKVRVLDREILMDPGLFFQSNLAMQEALIDDLREIAKKADSRLPAADIYCGVGVFAAFLGDLFPGLSLVEETPRSLALARENLKGMDGRFFPLSAGNWAAALKQGDYGFMVLDPPREGLSPKLRLALAEKGPPLLAYISCDPASLARDCRELTARGYRLAGLDLYDFYPQTAHIESLAVLLRPGNFGTA